MQGLVKMGIPWEFPSLQHPVLTSLPPRLFQGEGIPATIFFQDIPFEPTKLLVCQRGETKVDTRSAARGEASRCHASKFAESFMTTRPRSKEWFIGMVHGLVVPFGTSGMVQVDGPLVLVPLVPRRSEDPLLLVPLVPLRSEDPLLLVALVQRTPTCPNLSHLVVPLVFSQLPFLRFFLGF